MGRDHKDAERVTRWPVIAPAAALSVMLGGTIALFTWGADVPVHFSTPVLAAAAVLYLGAAAALVRYGWINLARLELLGLTDSLSGLPNRRALHRHFPELDGATTAAMALLDLDGFKQVNDHYGHVVGDRLIRECAAIFTAACGDEAAVYRLGGDEFAFVATGPIGGNILEGICRGLLVRLTLPIFIDERAITVGASIGLARCAPGETISSSELLRRTDVAMYASKRAGRMRCTWFSDAFDRHREALRELDSDLRTALAERQFHLVYQPLVDAVSQEVTSVEALIRWDRPDGKRIGPNIFIPIAEESGLINAIGLWVLRQGCSDALGWGELKLSINLSAAQLRNPEFPVELGYLLEETGFPPERLELEVTETHLVLDSVVAGRSMEVIRSLGVSIVLDDFGTGYASIGFLRQFRFEKLKLDRSLIADAATDQGSRAMMMASIAVARSLDMDVTAEGVETEAQAALVRSAGCDQIQGWLYFKPMRAAEMGALSETMLSETGAPPALRVAS